MMKVIDPASAAVSILEMYYDDILLSSGTCFFWRNAGVTYLVTNWHNLAGRDALTGTCLDKKYAALPNRIKCDFYPGLDINRRAFATFDLMDDGVPYWLVHPQHGSAVDVACIEVPHEIADAVFPLNMPEQFQITIATDVFVLGYPLGLRPGQLPIWKRATVATEPQLDVDNMPKMYIDTATTKGMSGSPVIHRASSGTRGNGDYVMMAGAVSQLVGVYSGRVTEKGDLSAQLGIVWKTRVIDEIINGGQRYAV